MEAVLLRIRMSTKRDAFRWSKVVMIVLGTKGAKIVAWKEQNIVKNIYNMATTR